MRTFLDFEKPIAELEAKIEELRRLTDDGEVNIADEVKRLEVKADKLTRTTYAKLSPWQKVQVARHPNRPHGEAYLARLIQDFTPLAGDRLYGEDLAIIGGVGRFRGRSVVVIAHERGHDALTRARCNFGMAKPEGYRKAQRLMRLAEQFGMPILTFVDTAGAYPGVEAEARGQAEAIAKSIDVCLSVRTPLVATIIGEGGSGGAVAIAAADAVLMLEHAVYSVISPEGCASILWRSSDQAQEAAEALKITAQDLLHHKLIDGITPEPMGGAHRAPEKMIDAVGDAVEAALAPLTSLSAEELIARRRRKFLDMTGKLG